MTTTKRERPWRAIAYVPDPTGQGTAGRKRVVAGRTSAATEAGLSRFLDRHRELGHAVNWWEVPALDFDSGEQNP